MVYTKGNWEVNKRASRNVKCNDITIANCSSGQGGEREDEEIANAKLIAAAPYLLEALKIVEKQSGITWDSKKGKDFEVGAMLHIIREAIKKAEGQL